MRKLTGFLLVPVLVFGMTGVGNAIPILGVGTGMFDQVAGASLNGDRTEMSWLSSIHVSSLTAEVNSISQDYDNVGGSNVYLTSLFWENNDNLKDSNISGKWNVKIDLGDSTIPFVFPNNLSISLQNGEKDDTVTLSDLSTLSWVVDGWKVSNFRYVLGTGAGLAGSLEGLEWVTEKGENSRVWIVADFTQSTPVPEPSTLLLLAGGLVSLAGLRFRKKR